MYRNKSEIDDHVSVEINKISNAIDDFEEVYNEFKAYEYKLDNIVEKSELEVEIQNIATKIHEMKNLV